MADELIDPPAPSFGTREPLVSRADVLAVLPASLRCSSRTLMRRVKRGSFPAPIEWGLRLWWRRTEVEKFLGDLHRREVEAAKRAGEQIQQFIVAADDPKYLPPGWGM